MSPLWVLHGCGPAALSSPPPQFDGTWPLRCKQAAWQNPPCGSGSPLPGSGPVLGLHRRRARGPVKETVGPLLSPTGNSFSIEVKFV